MEREILEQAATDVLTGMAMCRMRGRGQDEPGVIIEVLERLLVAAQKTPQHRTALHAANNVATGISLLCAVTKQADLEQIRDSILAAILEFHPIAETAKSAGAAI